MVQLLRAACGGFIWNHPFTRSGPVLRKNRNGAKKNGGAVL